MLLSYSIYKYQIDWYFSESSRLLSCTYLVLFVCSFVFGFCFLVCFLFVCFWFLVCLFVVFLGGLFFVLSGVMFLSYVCHIAFAVISDGALWVFFLISMISRHITLFCCSFSGIRGFSRGLIVMVLLWFHSKCFTCNFWKLTKIWMVQTTSGRITTY